MVQQLFLLEYFIRPVLRLGFPCGLGLNSGVSFLLKPRPNIKSHGLSRGKATSYNRSARTRKDVMTERRILASAASTISTV